MHKILTQDFENAISDYYYLINKKYPQKAILKLIGDRYQLDKRQRSVLYRGVYNCEENELQNQKKCQLTANDIVYIDFYNVFLTIAHYLTGVPCFISSDSFLRDCGESHGRLPTKEIGTQTFSLLYDYLKVINPKQINFILDRPISFSKKQADEIETELKNRSMEGSAITAKSADYLLKQVKTGKIATADSVIIRNSYVSVVDLAANVLSANYHPDCLNIKKILNHNFPS
ncbi:MAG: DUF434 domain-containing protein [Spirochaetes bacterium]|nr:DUF434 domain-containing protein [Spirochaetota bacterium]